MLALALLGVAALPPPPATPTTVASTDSLAAASWFDDRYEAPLYAVVPRWPARGVTPWTVQEGSAADLVFLVGGQRLEVPLALSGGITLDASAPQGAEGAILAQPPPDRAADLADLGLPLRLEPDFHALGSLPSHDRDAVRSPWAWRWAGGRGDGEVDVQRSGPDRVRLRGRGPIAAEASGGGWVGVRSSLSRALGGAHVAEEVELRLNLHLARAPVDQ